MQSISKSLSTIASTKPYPHRHLSSSLSLYLASFSLYLCTLMNTMKSSGQPPHLPATDRRLLTRATACLLLLSLGYTLGFLSSSSSPSPSPPKTISTTATAVPASPHDLLSFRTQCAPPIPHTQVLSTLLNKLYNGTSPYEGFPSPDTAAHLLPPSSHPRGWGSTGAVFSDLISDVRPNTIIELGTFLGASALHMASLTRNLSLPNTLILCVDDFRGWPSFRTRFSRGVPPPHNGDSLLLHQFMLTAAAAGEAARLLPLPFSTGSALAALCDWGVYGDLVEVDAGHDFHSAWADINRAWAVVRPGGVLFGHDYHTMYDARGVRRAVTLFAQVNGLTVRAHGQHWVLAPKAHTDGPHPDTH